MRGSFSAVWTATTATKGSFCRDFQDLQDSQTFFSFFFFLPRDAFEVQSGKQTEENREYYEDLVLKPFTSNCRYWIDMPPNIHDLQDTISIGSTRRYKSLHLSELKNSTKFRQTFSHFYSFIFKISAIFHKFCSKLANFDEFSPEFQNFSWRRSKSPRFSNFLRFRTENN